MVWSLIQSIFFSPFGLFHHLETKAHLNCRVGYSLCIFQLGVGKIFPCSGRVFARYFCILLHIFVFSSDVQNLLLDCAILWSVESSSRNGKIDFGWKVLSNKFGTSFWTAKMSKLELKLIRERVFPTFVSNPIRLGWIPHPMESSKSVAGLCPLLRPKAAFSKIGGGVPRGVNLSVRDKNSPNVTLKTLFGVWAYVSGRQHLLWQQNCVFG